MQQFTFRRALVAVGAGVLATAVFAMAPAEMAGAASTLSGPVNLGTASTYGVLGASAVTNTGPTVVNGDVGVSPQSSITGFTGAPNGTQTGTVNDDNAPAGQAQSDLTTAFNAAAGLTPTMSGLSELTGLSLTPGVYSGGALALSNNGSLTLAGSANSVWVFQAASSLTIGSGTHIVLTGGATSCNVFWEVGSSASLGTTAQFQGTVMAHTSITATTGATIQGRLLANTGAVTLQSNTITVPQNCSAGVSPTVTNGPAITSGQPVAPAGGSPYSFTMTATGVPAPTFAIVNGALPAGLQLNSTTGQISGTPTTAGVSNFVVSASNGAAPDVDATYSLTTAAVASAAPAAVTAAPAAIKTASSELAFTGVDPTGPLVLAGGLLLIGVAFRIANRRAAPRR
jgi:Ice-binding-like/Putative Ig domain